MLDDATKARARVITGMSLRSRPGQPSDDAVEVLGEDWEPVDLGAALRGEIAAPRPTVLTLEHSSVGLFYEGQVNGIHGDSGTGKTWAAILAAVQEIDAGNHVTWLDFEDPNEATIVGRLLSVGLTGGEILERFHYFSPKSPTSDLAVAKVCGTVAATGSTLVVIDSLGEAFGLEGLNEDKDVDVAPWLRRVLRRLADEGPAVVAIDHSTKSAENPLYPSGSKRKRAAITGASYLVKAKRPLTKDHGGELVLTCAKDRHGNYARGEDVATVECNVYPDGAVWHVRAPSKLDSGMSQLQIAARAVTKAVRTHMDENDGSHPTQRMVLAGAQFKGSNELKRAALELAVAHGSLVEETGPRRSKLYRYVRPFELDSEAAA